LLRQSSVGEKFSDLGSGEGVQSFTNDKLKADGKYRLASKKESKGSLGEAERLMEESYAREMALEFELRALRDQRSSCGAKAQHEAEARLKGTKFDAGKKMASPSMQEGVRLPVPNCTKYQSMIEPPVNFAKDPKRSPKKNSKKDLEYNNYQRELQQQMLNEEKHRVIREKETELNLRHQLVTGANPLRPSVYLKSDYNKRAPKKTEPGITEWSSREKLSRDVSRDLKKDSTQVWYGRQADYSPDKHCNRHNHHSSLYKGSIDLGTPSFDNGHKEVKRSKSRKPRDKLSKSTLVLTTAAPKNADPSAAKKKFGNNTPELTPKKKNCLERWWHAYWKQFEESG
jgi:hypothetical protein